MISQRAICAPVHHNYYYRVSWQGINYRGTRSEMHFPLETSSLPFFFYTKHHYHIPILIFNLNYASLLLSFLPSSIPPSISLLVVSGSINPTVPYDAVKINRGPSVGKSSRCCLATVLRLAIPMQGKLSLRGNSVTSSQSLSSMFGWSNDECAYVNMRKAAEVQSNPLLKARFTQFQCTFEKPIDRCPLLCLSLIWRETREGERVSQPIPRLANESRVSLKLFQGVIIVTFRFLSVQLPFVPPSASSIEFLNRVPLSCSETEIPGVIDSVPIPWTKIRPQLTGRAGDWILQERVDFVKQIVIGQDINGNQKEIG